MKLSVDDIIHALRGTPLQRKAIELCDKYYQGHEISSIELEIARLGQEGKFNERELSTEFERLKNRVARRRSTN